jgi:hypothetical protein
METLGVGMTKNESLKMAIEALEQAHSLAFKEIAGSPPDEVLFEDAIQACKDALEQPTMTYEDGFAHGYEAHRAEQALEQPAQEPVAWINYVWKPYEEESDDDGFYPDVDLDTYDNGGEPLYTHPAPSWQGLSDDEIYPMADACYSEFEGVMGKGFVFDRYKFARAIEQALKEKNT